MAKREKEKKDKTIKCCGIRFSGRVAYALHCRQSHNGHGYRVR